MKGLFLIIALIASLTLQAQHKDNIWLRSTFTAQDKFGLIYDFELQHRLQPINNDNLPNHILLNSARLWIHYNINNKLKLSVSPIALFYHIQWKSLSNQDLQKIQTREYRNSIALNYQFFTRKKVNLYIRSAIAGRVFSNKSPQFRWRNRIGADWKINKKYTLKPFYEIFYQSQKDYFIPLEQMRFNFGLQRNFNKKFSIELAYMLLLKHNIYNANFLKEDNFIINLQYKF